MPSRPQPLQHYLHNHHKLQQLHTQLLQQQKLLHRIQQQLPASLSPHCHTALLHNTQLTLAADSPVWANQLRYQAPTLLHKLRKTLPGIAHIQVHSRPRLNNAMLAGLSSRTTQRPCSVKQAQLLQDSAQHIQHPALSQALHRLAQTLHKNSE